VLKIPIFRNRGDFDVRTKTDKVITEIRRDRYDRFLDGGRKQRITDVRERVEQRIAEEQAKREAAQRIGTDKRK
jgi:hypothetical protein